MLCVPTTLHWRFLDAVGACLDRLEHVRPAPCRPTPETDSITRPRRDGLGWAASDVPLQHESESESYAKHRQRLTPHASQATRHLFLSDSVPVTTRLCSTRHRFVNGWARPCFSRFNAGYSLSTGTSRHFTRLPQHSALDIVNFCIVSLSSSVAVSIRLQPPHPSSPHTLAVPGRKIIRFIIKPLSTTAKGVYLNTLPSAHSYFLPATSMGLSHAHWSLTNSRSSGLEGSSLVNS
jgi:hypothetical protein